MILSGEEIRANLGSNIVIERKARGVGLITTRGFRDVLIIGREKRYQVYDLQIEKPAPLSPEEDDPLDWDDLAGLDAVYFTGRDPATLAACRPSLKKSSWVSPATPRPASPRTATTTAPWVWATPTSALC